MYLSKLQPVGLSESFDKADIMAYDYECGIIIDIEQVERHLIQIHTKGGQPSVMHMISNCPWLVNCLHKSFLGISATVHVL